MELYLQPCDLILVNGSSWLARAIRDFEQCPGEAPSLANHMAGVTVGGPIDQCMIVEALWQVTPPTRLVDAYGDSADRIKVVRPLGLSLDEQVEIAVRIENRCGERYPWYKLLGIGADYGISHAAGWITRLFGRSEPINWRICRRMMAAGPAICSTLWTQELAKYGVSFGVDPSSCDPDEADDYELAHPEQFEVILDWCHLRKDGSVGG